MKCLLLLALVALGCALPYYGGSKSINIDEDGTIVITGANGKKVIISKGVGNTDDKFIDISVEGPNLPSKKIRINEQGDDKNILVQNGPYTGKFNSQYWEDELRDKRSPKVASAKDSKKSKTQSDLLSNIFKQYEGIVDEKSYETLLKKVNDYVNSGELDSSVYDVLKFLHDQKIQEQMTTETSVQTTAETSVQTTAINKVPLVHSDIASLVKDYIWTNKYQPAVSGNIAPQQRLPLPQQYGSQLNTQQSLSGPWVQYFEQLRQPVWQWSQPQQYANSQQLIQQQRQLLPQEQQWIAQQQWVPQQQLWTPQQLQWTTQQPQWTSQQQQWIPQQQQWIPQQQQQWFPQQQQWTTQQQPLSSQQQQWTSQQQQWTPQQQQWSPQQQQWTPQQQQQSVPEAQQWISQQRELVPEKQQPISQQRELVPEKQQPISQQRELVPEGQQLITQQKEQPLAPKQQLQLSSQQQQWVPQQQLWAPQQQQWASQQPNSLEQNGQLKSINNPLLANYLGQLWNQQEKLRQQTTYPVKAGRLVDIKNELPWQSTYMNEGLVY